MNAVCLFHNLCGVMGIDIDTRIESLDLFTAEELARSPIRSRNCRRRNGRNS
jgi:hypothetical protein